MIAYYEQHCELQMERTVTIDRSGQYAYKLQKRTLKNGEAIEHDTFPAELIKWEEKGPRRSFMNPFKKYGRKRSYHMSGNLA